MIEIQKLRQSKGPLLFYTDLLHTKPLRINSGGINTVRAFFQTNLHLEFEIDGQSSSNIGKFFYQAMAFNFHS